MSSKNNSPQGIPLPKSDGTASKERAQEWLDAHAAFEVSLSGALSPASEFAPSLYQDNDNVGSIRFHRPLKSTDTCDDLQKMLDFCCPNSVRLPALEEDDDWEVTGRFPCSHLYPTNKEGHTITIDSWDGRTLCWTIHTARLYAIGGRSKTTSRAMTHVADCPMPEGSYWQIRQEFRGTLHCVCEVMSGIAT